MPTDIKRGDIIHEGEDGDLNAHWVVLSANRNSVVAVDADLCVAYRWSMHSDGIRVEICMIELDDASLPQSTWTSTPITLDEPPPEIAEFLRRNRR
jgi:hypothetical protein